MTRLSRYRHSKYNNVKTEIDGLTFDSKAESARYVELKNLKEIGVIKGFACQVTFRLSVASYRADFLVMDKAGTVWAEDVKGVETAVFKMKKKLWEKEYPWIELRIIK